MYHSQWNLTKITKNLEKTLRVLGEIPEIRDGARLWIDSLCIDQTDLPEKSEEVERMSDFYEKCDRVISYIGDEENHNNDVLEVMEVAMKPHGVPDLRNVFLRWVINIELILCNELQCSKLVKFIVGRLGLR